jgi:peroxiredoxin
LIWLPPFAVILREAYRRHVREEDCATPLPRIRAALKHMSQRGYTLLELSQMQPVLAVFLRHSGCVFCREALSDLSHAQGELGARGIQLALVHMTPEPEAETLFAKYGLQDVDRFSDPECELYRAFEVRRAAVREILAPAVWTRGIRASLFDGHGVGSPAGDTLRMPGVFLIYNGQVIRAHRYAGLADRPDYLRFVDAATLELEREGAKRPESAMLR